MREISGRHEPREPRESPRDRRRLVYGIGVGLGVIGVVTVEAIRRHQGKITDLKTTTVELGDMLLPAENMSDEFLDEVNRRLLGRTGEVESPRLREEMATDWRLTRRKIQSGEFKDMDRLREFREMLLKFNELVVNGEDPAAYDWPNFGKKKED